MNTSTVRDEFDSFEFKSDARTTHGWTYGRADTARPPVLFIHPINLQGACWKDVARKLGPERLCIMPDLRGHGKSSPQGPYSVDDWAEDCVKVLDHFSVARAHVVGASLGGPIGVYLCATTPHRFLSLSAIGSALAIRGAEVSAVLDAIREYGVRGMFERFLPEISVAPGTDRSILQAILSLTNPNDAQTVSEIWAATITTDVTPLAAQVSVPCLVCTGEFDRTCPVDQGKIMAQKLRTEIVILPGVGHLPMMEKPSSVINLLNAHLSAADDGLVL